MSSIKLWTQVRRIGVVTIALPLIAAAIVAGVGVTVAGTWTVTQTAIAVTWLSQLFTIAVGITATVTLTGDPIIELHEATPTSFRSTQMMRTVIVVGPAVVAAAVMFVPLHMLGVWPRDVGLVTVSAPISAAVFIVAVALVASAFSKSASTTSIAVIAGWIFVSLVWEPYVDPLVVRCGFLLLLAAAFTGVAAVRLGDSEKNIAKVVAV